MMYVIKRDGRRVVYEAGKVHDAIAKAFVEVDGELTPDAESIAAMITTSISDLDKEMSVEDIQDIIERKLMASKRKDVAKAFIIYRNDRSRIRQRNSSLSRKIREKLNAEAVENQNANVDEHSFGGKFGSVAEEALKDYALNELMSDMARENHLNNEIYVHDLSHYPLGDHNCLSIPFDDLLAKGFNTRQTDVRPAQSINTALQLVAVIMQLQSLQQFGGVSATHLDWTMVPYVRKSFYKHFRDAVKHMGPLYDDCVTGDRPDSCDLLSMVTDTCPIDEYPVGAENVLYDYAMDMTEKELNQAVEGMYHNLNTLQSRSGNQLPFSSINYGTCTLVEGRMVTKSLLDISINGIGKLHKTPIFPCSIFQMKKGVNRQPGDPNYDLYKLALKSTSLRLYPNYTNCDWSNAAGYDEGDPRTWMSTMGCRTVNLTDINGFGQLKDGRGNICPVTIILPTLAMEADRDVEAFMSLLDKKIGEAWQMLLERYAYICSQSPDSAKFMYENNVMAGYDGKTVESALKHGTLVIGQLGLAEALQLLIGCDHTEERGMELAKRIEQLFKDRCAALKKEYKLNAGVYYTPAEMLCYTAMQKFKDKYGEIPNVSDKKFFTNSMHVPVWKKMNPFQKIDIESQLTGYSSAGCITYVELDSSAKHNIEALEQLVNYAMDKDIPYFAINVPNDTCSDCGYTDEIGDTCPMCGGHNIKRLRRVTGLS